MTAPDSSNGTTTSNHPSIMASFSPSGHGGGGGGSSSNGSGVSRSATKKMSRTVNTVPAWARQEPPSPPQSPQSRPVGGNGASTWPRQDGRGPMTSLTTAAIQAKGNGDSSNNNNKAASNDDVDERPLSSHSESSDGTDDAAGPSRFWAFTLPSKYRGKAGGDDGEKPQTSFPLKRQQTNSSSTSSRVNQGDSEDQPRDRRGSGTATYSSTFADAVRQLASSAYMGRTQSSHARNMSEGEDAEKDRTFSRHQGRSKVIDEEMGEKSTDVDDTADTGFGGNEEWTDEEGNTRKARGTGLRSRRLGAPRRLNTQTTARSHHDDFSRHQPLTPGWDSPWHPEARGNNSIEIGKYRFNNFGEGGYFPRSESKQTSSSKRKTRGGVIKRRKANKRTREPSKGMTPAKQASQRRGSKQTTLAWWRTFLLHNAFVPLLFRLINITFTTTTLAVAIKLYQILRDEDAPDAVGSSPIVAIIFSPLTLLHVGIQIWLEYFSRPIGLWRVGSKLFYTLTELIFVCLWSAELSLSFDNYFTSTLVCTTFDSPYAGNDSPTVTGNQVLNNPGKKPYICRLQGALIGLVFTSLLAYVIVLTVSLFRIFVRVSRH